MKKYSLLLFDLDDTLLENSSWFDDGLVQSLTEHPLTKGMDKQLFLKKIKQPPKSLIEKLVSGEINTLEFKRERWKSAFDYFEVKVNMEAIEQLESLFTNTSMKFITVNEYVLHLMNELNMQYEVGIVTNGLYDPRQKIVNMGLGHIFSHNKIVHAEQIGIRKPDSRIYTIALEAFNKKPEETIFIGDSWTHDVLGPMEAGMDAIWVNSRGGEKPTDHIPYSIVSSIREIKDILLSSSSEK
ncbi:HAD family hydrolase [Rossellomorea aquimaris]|uniref:Putative hydrolase of the HAD superfamily n=1 Tax=Rossellomorea aquimaris TaxID=189382 RepID=A0A366EPV7_9BACI|nr:HAD family hydrolase [Rossellomorea aquimaris]RBP04418.1 putative hydrolase of the HAD superfamily [Rossellomorea aquimaris]